MLIGNGTGSAPHPIYRAVWLREAILGDHVAELPADVRHHRHCRRVRREGAHHQGPPRKASAKGKRTDCHARLDPWGIPFEHYNAIGKYQPLVPKEGARVSGFHLQTHGDLAAAGHLKTINTEKVEAAARVPNGPEVSGMADLKAYLLEHRRENVAENIAAPVLRPWPGTDHARPFCGGECSGVRRQRPPTARHDPHHLPEFFVQANVG